MPTHTHDLEPTKAWAVDEDERTLIAAARALEPTPDEVVERGLHREFGLTDDEHAAITARLGRLPTFTETGICSVLWSEHCSYKSSRRLLREMPTSGEHVLQGPGENAGVVDVGDGWAVAFKVESHNHPTAVEPVQGAATGVGGIVRDVFTMGARPIALLNSLRFGEIEGADPRPRRSRHLFAGAVEGIAGYGNCLGIPTVGGEVAFDDRYARNPLVNAMCIGLLRHEDLATGSAAGVGNPVLAIGARTGRDGIHGATFASVEDPEGRERSAVQVGDPFLEKLLMEATLELLATGDVVGIQDMGAAGLTSSSAEMASRAGSGIELEMLSVPRRETGMTAYELMLSESQERMLVVMRAGREHVADEVLARWGLEAAVVGRVTGDGMLRVLEGGDVVAELPVPLLVDEAPVLDRPRARPADADAAVAALDLERIADLDGATASRAALEQLLSAPTIASKRWVWRQYDHMVGTSTVVTPGSDAAVVRLRGTRRAIAASLDCVGRWTWLDPRRGAAHAVAEAARNVVCSGARPLAATDCLNFGSPEDPGVMWQLAEACGGLGDACRALGTPIVSGNVSLYNQSGGVDVYPTPVVGMVGVVDDVEHVTRQQLTTPGSSIVAVGPIGDGLLGGSEYLRTRHELVAGACPALDLEVEAAVQRAVLAAIRAGLVRAAHDVGQGGLAVALAEMTFGTKVGASVQLGAAQVAGRRTDEVLFGECGSLVLLEIDGRAIEAVAQIAVDSGLEARHVAAIGHVTPSRTLRITANGLEPPLLAAPIDELEHIWEEAIPCTMG